MIRYLLRACSALAALALTLAQPALPQSRPRSGTAHPGSALVSKQSIGFTAGRSAIAAWSRAKSACSRHESVPDACGVGIATRPSVTALAVGSAA